MDSQQDVEKFSMAVHVCVCNVVWLFHKRVHSQFHIFPGGFHEFAQNYKISSIWHWIILAKWWQFIYFSRCCVRDVSRYATHTRPWVTLISFRIWYNFPFVLYRVCASLKPYLYRNISLHSQCHAILSFKMFIFPIVDPIHFYTGFFSAFVPDVAIVAHKQHNPR